MESKRKKREEIYNVYSHNNLVQTVPPTSQDELMGIVCDYLLKNPSPTDSFSLLRNIKRNYRKIDYSTFVFKKLNINDIIKVLISSGIIAYDDACINLKRAFLIKHVDIEKLASFKMSLGTSGIIDQDFDKYYEKAKNIAISTLKEPTQEPDKDELISSSNQTNSFGSRKRERVEVNTQQVTNYTRNEDEAQNEDTINLMNNFIYAPTAKIMLTTNHYQDAQILVEEGTTDFKKVLAKIKKKYESSLRPFCEYGTRAECEKKTKGECQKVHFKAIIGPHTDVSLGDCSYLDTCRHMEICKFVHYQIEDNELVPSNRKELVLSGDENSLDSQWINCDIRSFDYSILGKFDVIMADPPWDIHMELPYGTLSDDEMKNLPVKNLQDDGVIFLWVTGRATELARECLELWGYERKEELVWIKTNQLQRLIRTGRTGHWLNHSKEHCLIGIKGNPKLNRNLDCDVLVSEVRETSRKPDEIYELIERMKPGGRKLELFARPHNRRKGWISLGNQCPGIYLVEEDLIKRFNEAYPKDRLTKEVMEENKKNSTMYKEN